MQRQRQKQQQKSREVVMVEETVAVTKPAAVAVEYGRKLQQAVERIMVDARSSVENSWLQQRLGQELEAVAKQRRRRSKTQQQPSKKIHEEAVFGVSVTPLVAAVVGVRPGGCGRGSSINGREQQQKLWQQSLARHKQWQKQGTGGWPLQLRGFNRLTCVYSG